MNDYTLSDLRAINERIVSERNALRAHLENMLQYNEWEIEGYDHLIEKATDDETRKYLQSCKEDLLKTRSEIEALKEEVNRK